MCVYGTVYSDEFTFDRIPFCTVCNSVVEFPFGPVTAITVMHRSVVVGVRSCQVSEDVVVRRFTVLRPKMMSAGYNRNRNHLELFSSRIESVYSQSS